MILLDQEPEASFGGQAWWSFGGLFLVDTPEQRRLRIHDSLDLAWSDWLGTAGFDAARDRVGPPLGPRLRRVGGRGEARLAARAGRPVLPRRRLGRARRRHGHRPRQLRPPLPHRLGHRPRHPRAVRCAAYGPPSTPGRVELRFRHRVDAGRRRRPARSPGSPGRCSSPATSAAGSRAHGPRSSRSRSTRRRGRRHLRRDRRRPRGRPQVLACPARPAARAHDLRRPRPRRRPHDRDHARPPAARSSTATGCGTTPRASSTTPRSGRRTASAILPGPSSLWFDADGRRLPAPLYPGFDTLGTLAHIRTHRARPHLVRHHPAHPGEGVRALRLRAEPRPHRPRPPRSSCSAAARARPGRWRSSSAGARTS